MSRPWTYSVEEAARVLRAEVTEVRRALRDGWFPGRFMDNGASIRIPRVEVEQAADRWPHYVVLEPDIEEVSSSVASPPGDGWSRDLDSFRSDLSRMLREEREALLRAVATPLSQQASHIESLESEVRGLRHQLDEFKRLSAGEAPKVASVEDLVQEIISLEHALGGADSED